MASEIDSEPRWPPRSPHEALLSTPNGRRRHRQSLDQISPSPVKRSVLGRPMSASLNDAQNYEDDEDDDEETLQLKLQEIQARLKLKKLQNAKSRENSELGQSTCAEPTMPALQSRRQSRDVKAGTDVTSRSACARSEIQVPVSPVRRVQPPQQQKSPSRHSFGIDKSLTMREVSLKRAPTQRSSREHAASHSEGFSERGRALNVSTASSSSLSSSSTVQGTQRLPTFNERLSASRSAEATRAQKQRMVQKKRSNAFGIGQEEMEEYKKNATEIPDDTPANAPTFTRQEILSQGNLPKSMTTPNLGSLPSKSTDGSDSFSEKPSDSAQTESSSFEPYSCFHLSRRILPHRVLARHVSGKKSLSLKDLLKTVKAPDYSLPDVDQDMVVFAVLARKSEPRSHQATANKRTPEGKYMVMTLVDLKMEVELFLFKSGFTRFWKLTEGTVLAILNPTVMPPPPGRQDTGRFSLVINSDADTILEIGAARDLAFCQSLKKDGDICGGWVNRKRTEFCEFHSNEAVRKQRSKRLEVNISAGFGGRKPNSRELRKPINNDYDWETKTKWFASRSHSAADLIDGKNRTATDKKEREDFLRRSLEAKEKEREIMKKLGRVGNAAGKEYMLMQSAGCRTSETTDVGDAPTAKGRLAEAAAISLGLHKGKDRAIHLSPIKRKRPQSSLASSSSLVRPGYGWGSSLKEKLTKMREGDEASREGKSPTRKKTRFVTDRGIREAGRDSLGKEAEIDDDDDDDDDDDELIIVAGGREGGWDL
ncbi:hypothetical protein CP532_5037 [Ophiocordyceps camponoti-leonardi (nom. inval.)]|nr:hypothetical protein CP532_5037 [Ophiocordyceps camponoti-leonardi (nom. inval.)]